MNKKLGNVYRCNTSGTFTLLLSQDFKFVNNIKIKHKIYLKCVTFFVAHTFLLGLATDLQLMVLNCNTFSSIPRKCVEGLCVVIVEWSYKFCLKEHYFKVNKLVFIVGWIHSWHSCLSRGMIYCRFLCLDCYSFFGFSGYPVPVL